MTLPDIDKQGHFWAGLSICLVGGVITGIPVIGGILAITGGAIRELIGNKDVSDFMFTAAGAVIGGLAFHLGGLS